MTVISPFRNEVFYETLEDLQWARIEQLLGAGADEAWSKMFALLEMEHRSRLAIQIGPRPALLARLVWDVNEGSSRVCLKYDAPPPFDTLGDFFGFR